MYQPISVNGSGSSEALDKAEITLHMRVAATNHAQPLATPAAVEALAKLVGPSNAPVAAATASDDPSNASTTAAATSASTSTSAAAAAAAAEDALALGGSSTHHNTAHSPAAIAAALALVGDSEIPAVPLPAGAGTGVAAVQVDAHGHTDPNDRPFVPSSSEPPKPIVVSHVSPLEHKSAAPAPAPAMPGLSGMSALLATKRDPGIRSVATIDGADQDLLELGAVRPAVGAGAGYGGADSYGYGGGGAMPTSMEPTFHSEGSNLSHFQTLAAREEALKQSRGVCNTSNCVIS
jgi:hypothetical protein